MKYHALCGLALAGAAGLAAAAPAAAATTTLDFAGNICGPTGGQACGDGSEIGRNYGDGVGVDVSYRSYDPNSNATIQSFLKYWSTNYGDLRGNVWGGNGPSAASEITFAALAGYELRVLSFDAGCYLDRVSCRSFPFTISEIGGSVTEAGTATPPANGHDSFTFGHAYSTSGYVLRWGPDGYDGGLDNIAFDVRAIGAAGAVPEPSTWAMLILGFGLLGGAMRRRSVSLRYA